MKSGIWKLTGAGILSLGAWFAAAQEPAVETTDIKPTNVPQLAEPVVEIALLLDTSNSMDGLIAQAKTQLWSVVNEFITAKQNGKAPVVKVALFEYGKSSLSVESHWIRQIQPLTRDLDTISQELFALTTNGGDEFCGAVIDKAVNSLAWSTSPDRYKAIFIAGNEPFTQGPVSADGACKAAIAKGIIVNTIHCGSEADGVSGGWKQGALLADGTFMVIDQDQAVAHIEAPQDTQILELNAKLNATYIPIGRKGQDAFANQAAQDANAGGVAKSNLAKRAATKASKLYFNAGWDIVDASQQKDFRWENVKKEELPKDLQKLTTEELKAHVEKQLASRKEVQEKILELTQKRDAWVSKKRQEQGDDKSFGLAVSSAIREQAATKGVTFDVKK